MCTFLRRFCFASFPLILAAFCPTMSLAESKPNVLLICVDDLKPTIGCFGDTFAKTPNIDALAKRGVRFESAYCNQAVCSPSRNALMTGLRPQTIGIYDLETHFRKAAPDAVTFSQHFIQNGYVAQGLGKIYHVGHGNTDDKRSWSAASWRPRKPGYVLETSLDNIVTDKKGKQRGPATESADVADDSYADGAIADEAI
ncbi:MAG TPA: iduronate-2-sulfatase, partial [Planctomycetaceae bacterium]|nr:iduronate-2-sulfatase [Planctomycetaceae bacterium]